MSSSPQPSTPILSPTTTSPPSLPIMSVNLDHWDGLDKGIGDNADKASNQCEDSSSTRAYHGDDAENRSQSDTDSQETVIQPQYPHMPQNHPIIPPLLYHLWATTGRWRHRWWNVPREMGHLLIAPIVPRPVNMFPGTKRLDDSQEELEAEMKSFIDKIMLKPAASSILSQPFLRESRKKKSDALEQPGNLPDNGWVSAGEPVPVPMSVQEPLRDIDHEIKAAERRHDKKWFKKQQRRSGNSAASQEQHCATESPVVQLPPELRMTTISGNGSVASSAETSVSESSKSSTTVDSASSQTAARNVSQLVEDLLKTARTRSSSVSSATASPAPPPSSSSPVNDGASSPNSVITVLRNSATTIEQGAEDSDLDEFEEQDFDVFGDSVSAREQRDEDSDLNKWREEDEEFDLFGDDRWES